MVREKEKLRSDLEKAERLKSLMASEVDDHHAAIERRNEYNLRYGLQPAWGTSHGEGLQGTVNYSASDLLFTGVQ